MSKKKRAKRLVIAIEGAPGSGKSLVGRGLADLLGGTLYADERHPVAARRKSQVEIYEFDGFVPPTFKADMVVSVRRGRAS